MPSVQRENEDHGFPRRLCRGGQGHRQPQADLCRREASAPDFAYQEVLMAVEASDEYSSQELFPPKGKVYQVSGSLYLVCGFPTSPPLR